MEFKGLKRKSFTTKWEEAFPIGNGTIGGLVFGKPLETTIVTNHEELFLPLPENADPKPFFGADSIKETRQMILNGQEKEATQYYFKNLAGDDFSYGKLLWTNPFETATKLLLNLEGDPDDVHDYEEVLDFVTGETSCSFLLHKKKMERKAFVSRTRNQMIIKLGARDASFDVRFSFAEAENLPHIESVKHLIEDNYLISEVTHAEQESGYVSAARLLTDGKLEESGDAFVVKGATYLDVFYAITPWNQRMEAKKVMLLRSLSDTPEDYDELLREHDAIHRELFERVKVSFSQEKEALTNEELRKECKDGYVSPALLERMADFGRYLEIASFGKFPPNLQGVWNGSVTPAWSSDYTLDENVQMMMWPVLPGSLPEFGRAYFDWLESYIEDFRENAKMYFGCKGILAAARVSSDGYARHFSEQWPMLFWTAGAGWLSSVYEDYYEYTSDQNALLRGVRFWKEVVAFYEDFMELDENGFYRFVPSYSPENTPLGKDSPTAVNATMDIAVAREVYSNLINAVKILGIEEENLAKWESEYEKLPTYTINGDGAVKEWIPKQYKDDYHHRHSSHLYMVFPGREALEDGNEDLLEACHKAADLRLTDGVDAISGWGLMHLANICARLKDSGLWYKAVSRLVNVFTLDNLFTSHNPKELFQMDANLGLLSAVFEMFAYSDTKKVELFPILCDEIPYASIEGFRARGCVRFLHLEKNGDEIICHVENQGKNMMRIVCPKGYSFEDGNREFELSDGAVAKLKAILREKNI